MADVKYRVLLVDDEPSIVKTIGKRLELTGFIVDVALDGEEAFAKARAVKPDLIVLDLMLPKYSGLKVCAMLKQEEDFKAVPIIIFTGKDQVVDQEACRKSGADSYIPKALGAQVLIAEINSLLKKVVKT